MKKLKVLLMTAVLSFALCACGGKEEGEPAASDAAKQSGTEQGTTEKSTKEKKKSKTKEYECASEVLESSLEDRMLQIGDVVLRFDGSMSLKEALEAFDNSDVEYEYEAIFVSESSEHKEFSRDRLIRGWEGVGVYVMKDGEECITIAAQNTSSETVTLSDDAVRLYMCLENNYDGISYCFNGMRSDGEGLTMESVKELMSGYDFEFSEWTTKDDRYVWSYIYEWEFIDGREKDGGIGFSFDVNDGTCKSVGFN